MASAAPNWSFRRQPRGSPAAPMIRFLFSWTPLFLSTSHKLRRPGMNTGSQSHFSSHYLAPNWTFRQPLSHLGAAIRLFSTSGLFASQAQRLDLIGLGLIILLIIMWSISQSRWVNVYNSKCFTRCDHIVQLSVFFPIK